LTEKEFSKLVLQSNQLDAILLKLMRCAKFDTSKPSPASLSTPHIDNSNFTKPPLIADAPHIGHSLN
jgi:hypothetical protein